MGYYARGDYYRGDYYRGDFLGLGNALKKTVGAIGKTVGAVAKVGSVITNPWGTVAKAISGGPPSPPGGRIALGPSGAGNYGGGGAGGGGPAGMRGYHLNKKPLPASKRHPAVPAHSIMVRNRHMNVTNVKALRRAARRAKGFLRATSKLVSYYQPKAKKGRAYVRTRKR